MHKLTYLTDLHSSKLLTNKKTIWCKTEHSESVTLKKKQVQYVVHVICFNKLLKMLLKSSTVTRQEHFAYLLNNSINDTQNGTGHQRLWPSRSKCQGQKSK